MEHTLALIRLAHKGDKKARDTLFKENMGLIYSVARRFYGRGLEIEELFQIGSIGLLKAIDKFDLSYEVKFSTYAVPLIIGEMRRFFRDDGILKVSRSLKDELRRANKIKEQKEQETGHEIGVDELAKEMGIRREELVMAMEAGVEVESLNKVFFQGDGNEICLQDRIAEETDYQEQLLNHLLIDELMKQLEEPEKTLLELRYFQDRTQTEIANSLHISQVQVSRMEKRILKKLREMLRTIPGSHLV